MKHTLKKIMLWMSKALFAGIIALFILSIFSLLYYNNGIRKTSITGATDYVWENRFWALGYEGFSVGLYDENGFNNPEGQDEDVDILLMGSSQMNAYNVLPKDSTGYLLNELLKDAALDYNVYNIGMEGHTIYANADNLSNAVKTYNPSKYVIIQTGDMPEEKLMLEVINGTRQRAKAYDTGMIYYLQKIPYFRLLNKQVRDLWSTNKKDKPDLSVDEEILRRFLKKLSTDCISERGGVKIIIFYTPPVLFMDNGELMFERDVQAVQKFQTVCGECGIRFIDMSDAFIREYNSNYKLPYGFCNTRIGKGHLNRNGHKIIAETLFSAICEGEEK